MSNLKENEVSDSQFAPHEQRVIDEHREVESNVIKLGNFIETNEVFSTLSVRDQRLMKKQLFTMGMYRDILSDRIKSFSKNWDKPELTPGETLIGLFGTEDEKVFNSKYVASILVDITHNYGRDPRRNAAAATKIEFASMMGVKSIFSNPEKPKQD